MTAKDILHHRLHNQYIASHPAADIAGVAAHLVATQAQDNGGAKWALGLRVPGSTDADIEQAIANRHIVRTWSLRGTLHFMAAADTRWLLELVRPVLFTTYGSYIRKFELDKATLSKCYKVITHVLKDGKHLTRKELMKAVEQKGISTTDSRSNFIMLCAALDGIICCGIRNQTYTLLDEWLPATTKISGDEALASIALRYFTSHGPATLPDFTWWSGLRITQARAAVAMVSGQLQHATIEGQTYYMPMDMPAVKTAKNALYLLPGFDQYLIGYKDRSHALAPEHTKAVMGAGNGLFSPTIVIDGRIAGTWKRTIKKNAVIVETNPFEPLTAAQNKALSHAVDEYSKFIGLPIE